MRKVTFVVIGVGTIGLLALLFQSSNKAREAERRDSLCKHLLAGNREAALALIPHLTRGRQGFKRLIDMPWKYTSCKDQGKPSIHNDPIPFQCKEWLHAIWLETDSPNDSNHQHSEAEIYFVYSCNMFKEYSRLKRIESRINRMSGSGADKTLWSWEELK